MVFVELRFLILFLLLPIFLNFNSKIFRKSLYYFLFSIIFLIHSYIQSKISLNNLYYNVLPIFILFTLFFIFDYYKDIFFKNLDKIIFFFLTIFFIFLIYQFFSYDNNFDQISKKCIGCFSKFKVFYKENSHFSLLAPTIIFYLSFMSKKKKLIRYPFLIIFILICFANLSMTYVAGLIILLFLIIIFRIYSVFSYKFFCILLIFLIPIMLNKDLDRRKISDFFVENDKAILRTNLSTEVYQVSLFVAKEALFEKPLGYGFNNYELAFQKYIVNYDTHNVETVNLNRKDGSINLSKIITEFGIFSLFLFYFLLSFLFSKKIETKVKVFLILPIIIQLFIRGVGYFNGGFVLFLFYAFLIWSEKHYNKSSSK